MYKAIETGIGRWYQLCIMLDILFACAWKHSAERAEMIVSNML